ncbi:DNA-directed RNA polymerase subunit beta' [Candidatus Parcubacteria bacterium]|nr:MAG: DNA-directed RNA polymerase subunit beta' [Candidatus Parcubacteria bacterium]
MINPIKTTDFDAIKLKLASPEDILDWSHGEIIRPETINYRTQKPEKDGLFCEKIFGPSKDWECYCGKYKKIRYKGIVCDKCGVEVTRSIVRRERMGHITLQSPATHIWFLRGISSKIGLILDISMGALEKVVYFASFIITDVNEDLKNATIDQIKQEFKSKKKSIESEFSKQITEIKNKKKDAQDGDEKAAIENEIEKEIDSLTKVKEEKFESLNDAFDQAQKELKELKPLLIISENSYQNLSLKYGHIFEAGIGAEAVRELLSRIDLKKTGKLIATQLETAIDSKKEKLMRRLKLIKSLEANNVKPEWMVMEQIPVIPPDLRPMVALDGGRFATSDLNDLYRRVINRNNRLKQLIELNAPEVICRNEKRMLQEAVDALIDNSSRASKTVTASTGQKRQLKSLADSLKGKQGRFRQNLLGKRIDYSGRSVIVVNPKLKLYQCGLPKIMALELFKPYVISKLIKEEIVHNVRSASRYIDAGHNEVYDILENITKDAFVLLNRAPTLHRLGIQAFKPTLIEGKAIQIHPLVCSAFNADFDGDQMAVHVPLTKEAKEEARDIMLSSHNLLKPATGDPIVAPGQDIVWGAFYLTQMDEGEIDEKALKYFANEMEVELAYNSKAITLHAPIKVRTSDKGVLVTTAGRVMYNNIIPEKLRFVNEVVGKGGLRNVIKDCLRFYGEERTVKLVDELKSLSFGFITKSGLSWGMDDLPYFEEKDNLIKQAGEEVEKIQEQYDDGLLTNSERYSKVIEIWTNTKEHVTNICKRDLPTDGPVYSMIESGARGSWAQLTQILGMKGLVTSPSGDIIELPVRGNFKRGFDVLEYFISTHGVRKGLSDTALRTANAGYLTRRLVDVAQDVIVTDVDCGDKEGVLITKKESDEMNYEIKKRIVGRYLASDLKNAKGKVLVKKGELITEDTIDEIANEEIEEANIRSVLSCKVDRGTCAKCYGYDLGYNKPVEIGVAVGTIAAQSIGEPGTQLTMRTFHTGGVAGSDDITQGLPRVEEIFETRPPKKEALLADVEGTVSIEEATRTIEDPAGKVIVASGQSKILKISYKGEESDKYYFSELTDEKDKESKAKTLVKDGDKVKKGQELFKVGKKTQKAENPGVVTLKDKYVKVSGKTNKVKEFVIPKGTAIKVKEGDKVDVGAQLTDGSMHLQKLFALRGRLETQKYIIKEIQEVYSSQGQPLNDKHVEIIVRQMFSRYFINDANKTDLLPGEIVERSVLNRANLKVSKKEDQAKVDQLLLGITKASLTTDSFLSAASFQETARVLIDAAVSGKIDYLEGLKENIIIGRLIPAGTGYKPREERKVY